MSAGKDTPGIGAATATGLAGAFLLILGVLLGWSGIDVLGVQNVDGAGLGDWIELSSAWIPGAILVVGFLALGLFAATASGKPLLEADLQRKALLGLAGLVILGILLFIQGLPDLSAADDARLLAEAEAATPDLEAQAATAGRRVVAFSLGLSFGIWCAILGAILLLASQLVRSGREGVLYGALATLFVGVNVAIHLVGIKIDLLSGGSGNAGCQAAPGFDCGSVNSSAQSMLFGVPISLLAIPLYALMIYLIVTAWRGSRSNDPVETRRGEFSLNLALCLSLLTVLYSIYLFYVSKVIIGKLCLFCMVLYGVNVLTAALLIGSTRGAILGPIFDVVTSLKPVLPALGVFVIVGGISWAAYDDTKRSETVHVEAKSLGVAKAQAQKMDDNADVQAAERERLKRLLLEKQNAAAQGGSDQDKAAGKTPNGPGPTSDTKTSARALAWKDRKCKKFDLKAVIKKEPPPPEKRGDGYRYYETPLDPDCDFITGNPEAIVSVVKYADFQCQYCKMLATAMKPLKEKYKDRVKFVMKQFPMNGKCNPRMSGYDKHPYACEAAYAALCAGAQDKFWEMHDLLYDNQQDLAPALIRSLAAKAGLDMAAYESCLVDPKTDAWLKQDIRIAFNAQIHGTPKTYVNNRLVVGSSTSILDYHIKRALQSTDKLMNELQGGEIPPMAPVPDGRSMIAVKSGDGTFYIDPYEASIDQKGRAVAFKGAQPTQANYFEAKEACSTAGKRLCTEAEWMTACTGVAAVDNNGNGWFSDDDLEGDMYPYGGFYKAGTCHDSADKYTGKAVEAGGKSGCRTRSGIFDLTGNIGEWVNQDENKATLMGGTAGSGERAACNQRSYGKGLGRKNHTTGFRCCADTNVKRELLTAKDLKADDGDLLQRPVPTFEVTDQNGKLWTQKKLRGKVTLLNFFASWCGPCKKEFPYLVKYLNELRSKGLQIVAFGQDSQAKTSFKFAKEYGANFPVAHDEDSKMMGLFRVYSMPTTFLVDRKGIVRYMDTGFKPAEQAAKLRAAIEDLL